MTVGQLTSAFRNIINGTLRVYSDVNKQKRANFGKRVKTIQLKDKIYENRGSISTTTTIGEFCKEMRLKFGLVVEVATLYNNSLVADSFPLNELILCINFNNFNPMEGDSEETPGSGSNYRYLLNIILHENIDQTLKEPFDTKEEAEERVENFIEEKASSLSSWSYTVSKRPDGRKEILFIDSDWWYELWIEEV